MFQGWPGCQQALSKHFFFGTQWAANYRNSCWRFQRCHSLGVLKISLMIWTAIACWSDFLCFSISTHHRPLLLLRGGHGAGANPGCLRAGGTTSTTSPVCIGPNVVIQQCNRLLVPPLASHPAPPWETSLQTFILVKKLLSAYQR